MVEDNGLARDSLQDIGQPKEKQGSIIPDNRSVIDMESSDEMLERLLIEAKKRNKRLKMKAELARLEEENEAMATDYIPPSIRAWQFGHQKPSPPLSTRTTPESLAEDHHKDARENNDYFHRTSSSRSREACNSTTEADWQREKENIRRKYLVKRQTRFSILHDLREDGWKVR
jgi:hypothetical protein